MIEKAIESSKANYYLVLDLLFVCVVVVVYLNLNAIQYIQIKSVVFVFFLFFRQSFGLIIIILLMMILK